MELSQILPILSRIKGVTFASLDAVTKPAPGLRKETLRERVLLYNSGVSGYERMVRRRLAQEGLDPDGFSVGDLPWGTRLDGLPSCVLTHKGEVYIQTILLGRGHESYFTVTGQPVSHDLAAALQPRRTANTGGLLGDKAVVVHAYAVKSIQAIRLLGETVSG